MATEKPDITRFEGLPFSSEDVFFAGLCKALGHSIRIRIVKRLIHEPGCFTCGEIIKDLPLAQSTVSQHLKVLKHAGWIIAEPCLPQVCYRLNRDASSVPSCRKRNPA